MVLAPVLDQLGYSVANDWAQLDFSQTGTLVYRSGTQAGEVTVQWVDRAGNMHPLVAKPGPYGRPKFSPDGERLALELSGQGIWVYESKRDNLMRLTSGGGTAVSPLWSPDGRYIVFQTPEGIAGTRADGTGKAQSLTQNKDVQYPWCFSPDGKRLMYFEGGVGGFHIWTLSLETDASGMRAGKPEMFLQTQFDDRYPSFSPDGKWLADSSTESRTFQVYVTRFPEKNSRWQISNSGGVYPMWSGSGHELFFESLDYHIMVAAYTERGDSFVPETPRVWSEKQLTNTAGTIKNFDLAPDGKRIVALMPTGTPEEQKPQNHVIFLENFFDEVRRHTATQAK